MEKENKKINIKIVIPAVLIVIFTALMGVIVLIGNNGTKNIELDVTNKSKDYYNVGDTITGENFEVTLKSVEFVDFINLDKKTTSIYGNDYGTTFGDDNFGLSVEPVTRRKTVEQGSAILSYTLDFKYVGKSEYRSYSTFGKPIVKYNNEYTFSQDYLSTSNKGDGWTILCVDNKYMGLVSDIYNSSDTYKPLSGITYHVRGFITIPLEVENNLERPLTIKFLNLSDKEFIIR